MNRRKLFFSLLLLCCFNCTYSQSNGKFYEVDSSTNLVKLFFNNNYLLVPKKCATCVRYTKIDGNANFTGDYIDSTFDNKVLSRGHYTNGNKDGYFEFYYPDETIQSKGHYAEDAPIGEWSFYYPNGKEERTLSFTGTDTLLTNYNDTAGNAIIVNGKGNFYGAVAYPGGWPHQYLVAKGKVDKGKPEGAWTCMLPNGFPISEEMFKDGKFIEGILVGTPKKSSAYHLKQSKCTIFFLTNYLERLEDFTTDTCRDIKPYTFGKVGALTQYSFDYNKFYMNMRTKLNSSIPRYLNLADRNEGSEIIKFLTIEFTVNSSGKADDFKNNSFWGNEIFFDIKECIRANTAFSPSMGKLYFHLKLDFSERGSFIYNFYLSQDPVPR